MVVEPSGDALIRLQAYREEGIIDQHFLLYEIISVPPTGLLYQLSQVFDTFNTDPKNGLLIQNGITNVTGSLNRVYYKRPSTDYYIDQMVRI